MPSLRVHGCMNAVFEVVNSEAKSEGAKKPNLPLIVVGRKTQRQILPP